MYNFPTHIVLCRRLINLTRKILGHFQGFPDDWSPCVSTTIKKVNYTTPHPSLHRLKTQSDLCPLITSVTFKLRKTRFTILRPHRNYTQIRMRHPIYIPRKTSPTVHHTLCRWPKWSHHHPSAAAETCFTIDRHVPLSSIAFRRSSRRIPVSLMIAVVYDKGRAPFRCGVGNCHNTRFVMAWSFAL